MTARRLLPGLVALALGAGLATGGAQAARYDVATGNAQNGVTDIYSATFDPPLNPCTGASPAYCSFFGGDPPASRALVVTPNPTTVSTGVPGGIEDPLAVPPVPAPAAGSFVNLAVNGNGTVTLTGGTLRFPTLIITISGATVVQASGAGFVFDAAPQTVAVDANGQAEFLVNLAPALAANFSTLSQVVTSCTGPLCALVPILTLDMIRYRFVVDFDASFGSFTGSFIGQTANNSMLFVNINSGVPVAQVTDSLAPADDLQLPFGDVTELTSATQTVTVTNSGGGRLAVGAVAGLNPLAGAFATANDTCSGADLGLAESCTVDVVFTPPGPGGAADGFDIPSNDAASPATVAVTGNGVAVPVPNIVVSDSVAPGNDGLLPFGNVLQGATQQETLTISNDGTADLALGTVGSLGGLAAPFSIAADSCTGATLATGGSCTVIVAFAPDAVGAFSGTLDIPSNDPDTPSATVTVTGSGAPVAVPAIQVNDPTAPGDDRAVSFQGVRPGGTYELLVTVVNAGTADLELGAVGGANGLAEPFSLVAGEDDCSGATLAPDASCSVRLAFSPTALGDFTDAFSIASNDPGEPLVTVGVAGSGVEAPPPFDVSPSGADSGFMGLDPATLGLLAGAGAWAWRRRRAA